MSGLKVNLMISSLRALGARVEGTLAGQLPAAIRKNMLVELWVGMAYGAFYAMTIPFIPVLLRRSGATPEMLAIYTSQQFLGSVLTAFSIVLMRRRRTMNIIVFCWLLSRSLILFFAFIVDPVWMLVLMDVPRRRSRASCSLWYSLPLARLLVETR